MISIEMPNSKRFETLFNTPEMAPSKIRPVALLKLIRLDSMTSTGYLRASKFWLPHSFATLSQWGFQQWQFQHRDLQFFHISTLSKTNVLFPRKFLDGTCAQLSRHRCTSFRCPSLEFLWGTLWLEMFLFPGDCDLEWALKFSFGMILGSHLSKFWLIAVTNFLCAANMENTAIWCSFPCAPGKPYKLTKSLISRVSKASKQEFEDDVVPPPNRFQEIAKHHQSHGKTPKALAICALFH